MALADITATRTIPVVVGPTASGKSDLGLSLAARLNGEIINLDAVQVYRRLYIATAKVPIEQQRGVPHHLIDIAEPTENFTAGEYARRATEIISDIESRGRVPIMVGGTGFYLRALVKPLFDSPNTDLDLRDRLRKIVEQRGSEHLHKMLARVDPAAASRLQPKDAPRTMRALEVRFQTGGRLSELQARTPDPPEFASRVRVIALCPPRQELYSKINERADRMFASGLVEEVKGLLGSGVPWDAKAFQAHGYKRVVEYLRGLRSRESALEQMKLDTRHYAKRQLSWWRAWPDVKWVYRFGDQAQAFEEALGFILHPDALRLTKE